jgi:hypothetical protein
MSDDNEQMEMDIGQFAASISVIQNKLIGDFLHDVGHICHKYMNEFANLLDGFENVPQPEHPENEKINTNLILIDGDKE